MSDTSCQEMTDRFKTFIRESNAMSEYDIDEFEFEFVEDEYVLIRAVFENHFSTPSDFTNLRRFAALHDFVATNSYSHVVLFEPIQTVKDEYGHMLVDE